jgi:hypothetical protein
MVAVLSAVIVGTVLGAASRPVATPVPVIAAVAMAAASGRSVLPSMMSLLSR